jgi:ABC-type transport system involved in multi-copper enzyme maturation permease subunit
VWQIARTVFIEAVRRKEIYVLVILASILIGTVMTLDFFELEGLTKFYREFSLKLMSAATAVTVIVLASRQLPREFETRTIYPLLARPIGRTTFLFGKLVGVWLSALFCFSLFMVIYILGMLFLGGAIQWSLFAQYLYLQAAMMLILATLGFALSMLCNVDAAITFGVILFGLGATLSSIVSYIYHLSAPLTQKVLLLLTYVIPQLMLFDLSEKSVHGETWDPLSFQTMATLTLYALVFSSVYFVIAAAMFRRRPL